MGEKLDSLHNKLFIMNLDTVWYIERNFLIFIFKYWLSYVH